MYLRSFNMGLVECRLWEGRNEDVKLQISRSVLYRRDFAENCEYAGHFITEAGLQVAYAIGIVVQLKLS
jgi:hypothetical protein